MNITDQNMFFKEVSMRILGNLDIQKSLESVGELLSMHIPFDAVALSYYEPENNGIYRVASLGNMRGYKVDQNHPVKTIDPDLSRELSQKLKSQGDTSIIISNQRDDDPISNIIREFAPEFIDVSVLYMELCIGSEPVGELWIHSNLQNPYTEVHRRLIASVNEPIAMALSNVRRYNQLYISKCVSEEKNTTLREKLKQLEMPDLVGAEFGLKSIMEKARSVASMSSIVLITGETGVGKEELARYIHEQSDRKNEPFIRVNCGAISETLVDTELFGHEEGAFTDAMRQHLGYFEQADGGTILLDEISELSLQIQTKLLRVIESKEFYRVGGTEPIQSDMRIIAATNQCLEKLVESKRFRQDLYFRLYVFPLNIPPLRERIQDIPLLVHHFIRKLQMEMGISEVLGVDEETMKKLINYSWPGNVRELKNAVERAMILRKKGRLDFHFLSKYTDLHFTQTVNQNSDVMPLKDAEANYIQRVLHLTEGRIQGPGGAADLLKINPSTLRSKIIRLNIDKTAF